MSFVVYIGIGGPDDAKFRVDKKRGIESSVFKPTQVRVLEEYRIWIEFEDGVQGIVDLSGYVGRGVWKAWEDRSLFESVRITPYRALGWGEDDNLDMCADWAYMQVSDATHPA